MMLMTINTVWIIQNWIVGKPTLLLATRKLTKLLIREYASKTAEFRNSRGDARATPSIDENIARYGFIGNKSKGRNPVSGTRPSNEYCRKRDSCRRTISTITPVTTKTSAVERREALEHNM
mmetsp:Transcript_29198/g.40705  ORF Transcript_29198/g.40705 Transcript_29198/m.40705 type:complete len:121 (-) Transcript_29198:425-787(-)